MKDKGSREAPFFLLIPDRCKPRHYWPEMGSTLTIRDFMLTVHDLLLTARDLLLTIRDRNIDCKRF